MNAWLLISMQSQWPDPKGEGGGGLLYEKIGYDCQKIEIKTPQRRLIWAWLEHYLIPKRYDFIPEDIHTFQMDGTFS